MMLTIQFQFSVNVELAKNAAKDGWLEKHMGYHSSQIIRAIT